MKSLKTSLKYQTKELFDCSSLHGVKYIIESNRSVPEKLIWLCIVMIFATSGLVTISKLWEKFQTDPTITGIDTDFVFHELQFPMVSVCPQKAYDEELINQEILASHDPKLNSSSLLEALTALSYDNLNHTAAMAEKLSEMKAYWSKVPLRDWMFRVHIKCNDTFEQCKFKDETENCCKLFQPIYTERGFCYAFNSPYYATKYSEERTDQLRTFSASDVHSTLEVRPKIDAEIYVQSTENVLTYDDSRLFEWNPNVTINIMFSLKQTYTTDDVKELTVSQRKCIFPDEDVGLDYYNNEMYSFTFCMKECRMKTAMKLCSCIPPFYAPENAANYRECQLDDLKCLANYSNVIKTSSCQHCQLNCQENVIDIEKFDLITDAIPKEKVLRITLAWPTIRYKRELVFGWIDLLVSAGGILGLFMGLSLLSVVEIIYFLTVRVFFMIFHNAEKLKLFYEEQKQQNTQTEYDMRLNILKKNERQPNSVRKLLNSTIIVVAPYVPEDSDE